MRICNHVTIIVMMSILSGCSKKVEKTQYWSDVYGTVFSHIVGYCELEGYFTGERIIWHKSRITKSRIALTKEQLRKGRRHGLIIDEIEDLSYFSNYKDGLRHGVYSVFSQRNRLLKSIDFVKGKISGNYSAWTRDGTLSFSAEFQNGVLSGSLRSWWPNGKISRIYNIRKGEREGEQWEWDIHGRVTLKERVDGKRINRKRWIYHDGKTEIVTEDIEKRNETEEETENGIRCLHSMEHIEMHRVTCDNYWDIDTLDHFAGLRLPSILTKILNEVE